MPEIWMRYGTTDIVLDIKFENLANQISSKFQSLEDQDIKTELTSRTPLTDKVLLLALSASKAAAKIITMLTQEAHIKGLSVTIDVPQNIASTLRSNLAETGTASLNRIGYQALNDRIAKFQNTIHCLDLLVHRPLYCATCLKIR
jgi:hypothetical protein